MRKKTLKEAVSTTKLFKLHYHISNNGDGSASVCLHKTAEEAEKADSEMDEGWGESCNGDVDIKLENGKLYYGDYDFNPHTKKYETMWYPLESINE